MIPVLDSIVCCALDGLDGGFSYEADEAFDCAVSLCAVVYSVY